MGKNGRRNAVLVGIVDGVSSLRKDLESVASVVTIVYGRRAGSLISRMPPGSLTRKSGEPVAKTREG